MMLGELLIAEGALDAEGLQEALDWQVLYGGRLGTNLLELQLVDEKTLALALGKQYGCEVVFGELQTSPEVKGLVPPHVADKQEIVPWKMERRRLKVICARPDVEVFDGLAFKLNHPCSPVVAPEFRVIQLLRREFGAKRQMRALDFGVVPAEQIEARRRRRQHEKDGAGIEAPPELIDETAFNEIYNQVLAGRDARASDGGRPRATAPVITNPQSGSFGAPVPPAIGRSATPTPQAESPPPANPEPPAAPAHPHAVAAPSPHAPIPATAHAATPHGALPVVRAQPSDSSAHAHRGHPNHASPPAAPTVVANPSHAASDPSTHAHRGHPLRHGVIGTATIGTPTSLLSDSEAALEELDIAELQPLGDEEKIEVTETIEPAGDTAQDLTPIPFALAHPEPSEEEKLEAQRLLTPAAPIAKLVPAAPIAKAEPPPPPIAKTPPAAPRAAPPKLASWDAPPPAALPVDTSPLAFSEALKLLAGVTDRDAIAHIVLRCARGHAARALLMTVQGNVALGWDGLGEGFEGGAARTIAVPLAGESVFQLVVKMQSHFMGPLRKTPANVRFLAQCGKQIPLSVVVLPILFRGRVSHLLYLDNGHKKQAPTEVGEMLILAQKVTQTVDALVAKKQRSHA